MLVDVAHWLHAQWFGSLGESRAAVAARLAARRGVEGPPLTLLALRRGLPVGTVSLVPEPHPFTDATVHCVADLFVCPAWRRQGVGSALCRAAVQAAQRLGIRELALFTVDAEDFYRRQGWRGGALVAMPLGRTAALATFMQRPIAAAGLKGRRPGRRAAPSAPP